MPGKTSEDNEGLSPEEKRALLARLLREEAGQPKTFPASFAQQRLWFLHQLEPDSPVYNVPIAMRLTGQLDTAALKQSLNEVIRRHEVLRTTFKAVDGQPAQVISPALTAPLPVVNLQALPEAKREAEAQRLVREEARHLFDPAKGPLLKAVLLRLGQEEYILLVVIHHIVFDGWSRGVFTQELLTLYEAFSLEKPSPLPELPIQYADFTHWQRQWLPGKVLKSQLAYWKQQLAGTPPLLELPTDRPRPPVQTFQGDTEYFQLSAGLAQKLKAQSQQSGTTLFMTLLAAFAVLLARYSGQEDVVIGSPIAGRNRKEIEPLIGFFINTLALRIDLSSNPTFQELLSRVRRVALGAYAHQDFPFEKLVDELQSGRNLSHTPIFQVIFVLQNAPKATLELPGLIVKPVSVKNETSKFDLTLFLEENEVGLTGKLEYSTDLFKADTISRMAAHFQTLLEGMVANPSQPLSDLPLLTETERHQLLVEWNNTQIDGPHDICLYQLFEAQVEQTPDSVAVIFEDTQLTYRELNRRANQLAHYLQMLGVGPEILVGICVERSLEMALGVLGILKAGGAYVPLDATYPQERLAFMLQDTQVLLALTQQKLVKRLPDEVRVICLDTDWLTISGQSKENPVSKTTSRNMAYVIFTSGSTGQPKGVIIQHKSLSHYLDWVNTNLLNQTIQSLPLVSNLTFDASLKQLFAPLLRGDKVWILSKDLIAQPAALLQALSVQTKVGFNCVPSLWAVMLDEIDSGQARLPVESLISLFVGGEQLSRELVDRSIAALPHLKIWNLYGPTEATSNASIAKVFAGNNVSIGRPIANTQIYLLDSYLQPVPIGIPGELYIGGVGLARGYLGHPDLTAERFIPDPFSDEPGARLYKTGDLGRYLPDGNIEFLGRVDRQVKIRGFRIELGEIEALLGHHPAVREVVVTVRDPERLHVERQASRPDRQLAAYFVPVREPPPTRSELRNFLKEKLPDYMIPSTFIRLNSIPLTPAGKVNRKALPAPDTTRPELAETYLTPRNPVEEMLVGIWAEVLGLERVGVHDNFFELGGHSLQAIQLISRVSAAVKRNLSVKTIFLHPTIVALADILQETPPVSSSNTVNKVYSKPKEDTISAASCPSSSSSPSSDLLKIERRSLLSLFAVGKIGPVDAAAFGYLRQANFGHIEPVRNWFDDLPVWYRVIETFLGRTAIILLPRFGSELYANEKRLVEKNIKALEMAKHLGARTVSLTGLIPSATNYGQAIASAILSRPDLPAISTGHATTTATVVMTIKRILQESEHDLTRERVGVLGLGSIGATSLRLMLKCLPHPSEIILCDLYSKLDVLEKIKQELVTDFGFQGVVRIAESQAEPPPEFYKATTIIGATNVPDILDIARVNPGTIIVDDSHPHCFEAKVAIQRFQEQEDILFTEGGVLKSPDPISELRYVPKEAAQSANLSELNAVLSKGGRHNPYNITGCVFSSLLSACFEDLKPTVGLVDVETCLQHYEKLNQLGFQAADLHCRDYILPEEIIRNFRHRFGKAVPQR